MPVNSGAVEQEIKLSLDPGNVDRACRELLAMGNGELAGKQRLVNRYFDTPACDLNRQRIALRIRQIGDRFVQTLKTQGKFVDGGFRRQEWEWPLKDAELDLTLLSQTPLDDQVDLASLKPVFETNFDRQIMLVREFKDPSSDGEGDSLVESLVEVAVDNGRIVSGDDARPLTEIEFEMKSGDPAALGRWAREFAQRVPVFLNLISKAEQGYYLAGLHTPEPLSGGSHNRIDVHSFMRGLSICWLINKPLPLQDVDLSPVAAIARQLGRGPDFDALVSALRSDVPVREVFQDQRFGMLQLVMTTGQAWSTAL